MYPTRKFNMPHAMAGTKTETRLHLHSMGRLSTPRIPTLKNQRFPTILRETNTETQDPDIFEVMSAPQKSLKRKRDSIDTAVDSTISATVKPIAESAINPVAGPRYPFGLPPKKKIPPQPIGKHLALPQEPQEFHKPATDSYLLSQLDSAWEALSCITGAKLSEETDADQKENQLKDLFEDQWTRILEDWYSVVGKEDRSMTDEQLDDMDEKVEDLIATLCEGVNIARNEDAVRTEKEVVSEAVACIKQLGCDYTRRCRNGGDNGD